MQYAPLGKTGLNVSRLGFGAMRLLADASGGYDVEATAELMRRAFDLGVNFVDSQYHYCSDLSETCVGLAARGRRENIIIQTKAAYYNKPDYRPGETHRTRLEETLRRLNTDYLDLYLLHSLRMDRWQELGEEWIQMALKAREEGLIRHIGFSCHDTPENAKALMDTGYFEAVLMQYNLLDQRYEECFTYAREKGIGTMVMGPIGGGRLAESSDRIMRGAPNRVKTPAEMSLRFVLSNPDVDCAFSGMCSVAEIDENCAVASDARALGPRSRRRVLRLVQKKKELTGAYCSACNYCTSSAPKCPHGVAISAILGAMALHKIWGLTSAARQRYARLRPGAPDGEAADKCVECGECEPKCPQAIPIRIRLKKARKALEQPPTV